MVPHDFFSFFVWNIEKCIVWRIFAKENYCNLKKNSRKFWRVSLKGILLSVKVLECFGKIF